MRVETWFKNKKKKEAIMFRVREQLRGKRNVKKKNYYRVADTYDTRRFMCNERIGRNSSRWAALWK